MRQVLAHTQETRLRIRGMHCAGCVASVEAALKQVPGVSAASVNLATQQARVSLEPWRNPVAAAELIAAVQAAGYDGELLAPGAGRTEDRGQERVRQLRKQRRRIKVAIAVGLPAILAHHLQQQITAVTGLTAQGVWILEGLLALAVMSTGAGPMLLGAWRALLRLRGNMDLLVSLGASVAFVAGVLGILLGQPGMIMFEAAMMITVFVAVGKYFEAHSRGQASAALEALFTRIPREAIRVVDGRTESVAIDDIRVGDTLQVAADTTVPVDGNVTNGTLAVDESMLTGESLPVDKKLRDEVFGGTRCLTGFAEIVATATGEDSAAARIARLIEDAQASKTPWQRLADRIAGVFVPIVLFLAVATSAGWLWLADADLLWATKRMITVLVVACPCALGLAIPTAVLVGTAKAGERGILVRDPTALEAAGQIRQVLLDKTGTLTIGRPVVTDVVPLDGADADKLARLAASLEQYSEHPLGRAVVEHAERRGLERTEVRDFASEAGGGLRGTIDGRAIVVGSAGFLKAAGIDPAAHAAVADELGRRGSSTVWIALGGRVRGLIGFADELHPESAQAIARLTSLGVRPRILSGDRAPAVAHVAHALCIEDYQGDLTPDEKLALVQAAAQTGKGFAMVGDGINDAPALAAADVGIAIGTGADVARETASICLVGHSPKLIADAIEISRRIGRVMRQNLFWALMYNLVMFPLAIFTTLPPAAATAAMMMSSLSVVVAFPFRPGHYFSLPILLRLYINKKTAVKNTKLPYRTRPELALQMLAILCKRRENRRFHVVGDSTYGGQSVLARLPANYDLTSRLDLNARLYDALPVRKPGTNGRPRKRGRRLPTPRQMLDQRTRRLTLNIYGRRDRSRVADQVARVHAVPQRLLRIVALEPLTSGRRSATWTYRNAEGEPVWGWCCGGITPAAGKTSARSAATDRPG